MKTKIIRIVSDKFILFAILVAFLIRLPGLFQELPPYQFCDEEFFWGEVGRMLLAKSIYAQEFRAGGANIYPIFYLAKFFNNFIPGFYNPTWLLIFGRLLLVGVLGSLNILLIKKISDHLFDSDLVSKISIILYVISPFILSNSRIWYPDNYIFVFSGIFFLGLIKIIKYPLTSKNYIVVAVGVALAISTKYTGILLFIPLGLIFLINFICTKYSRKILLNIVLSIIIFLIFIFILNYSAFFNLDKFFSDFNSNRNIYKNHGSIDWKNYLYYFNFTFIMVLGILAFPLWLIGGYFLINKSCKKIAYIICLSIPVVYIVFLGSLGKVLSRNATILIPFVLPIVGYGIYYFIYNINLLNYKLRFLIIILGLIIPQSFQTFYIFYHNLYPDSRIVAKKWLQKNVNPSSTIGFNDACSGSSPANVIGLKSTFDPTLKFNLDYYVLNSYWSSILDGYYFNRYGYLRFFDQKYIHFYEYQKNDLFKIDRFEDIKNTNLDGYTIIKIFQYNGPDVIILKRIN